MGAVLMEGHLLELLSIRSRDLSASDSSSGGIEIVETVLHCQGKDLGSDTEGRVDNLGLNAVLLLEVLSGNQRLADSAAEGHDGQVLAGSLNLGLAEGNNEVVLLGSLGHGEALTIHQLVLENNDRVRVTDGGLQETLGILGAPGRNDLETGNAAVPGGVVLGVLSSNTSSKTVGTTECDVTGLDATRHVEGLGSRVDNLIDSLHGKVEGHKLTLTRQKRVDDTLVAEAVEETLGHLVGTVVLGNLFSEDENFLVLVELLSESLIERISDGVLLDAGAVVGVGSGLGGTENNGSRKSSAGDGRLSNRRSNGSADSSSRSSEASCGSKNARHDIADEDDRRKRQRQEAAENKLLVIP
ncbi:hypothetical protein HG531_014112 [Fusarium graminearum]|nr:hypothetical protein HG531_014112 [Fusarium graminearum]